MSDEIKSLIEDAAKLLHFQYVEQRACFNPLDPERGDLMKVAEAAGLSLELDLGCVFINRSKAEEFSIPDHFVFTPNDHQSLALAILRAASAVYKSRGGV